MGHYDIYDETDPGTMYRDLTAKRKFYKGAETVFDQPPSYSALEMSPTVSDEDNRILREPRAILPARRHLFQPDVTPNPINTSMIRDRDKYRSGFPMRSLFSGLGDFTIDRDSININVSDEDYTDFVSLVNEHGCLAYTTNAEIYVCFPPLMEGPISTMKSAQSQMLEFAKQAHAQQAQMYEAAVDESKEIVSLLGDIEGKFKSLSSRLGKLAAITTKNRMAVAEDADWWSKHYSKVKNLANVDEDAQEVELTKVSETIRQHILLYGAPAVILAMQSENLAQESVALGNQLSLETAESLKFWIQEADRTLGYLKDAESQNEGFFAAIEREIKGVLYGILKVGFWITVGVAGFYILPPLLKKLPPLFKQAGKSIENKRFVPPKARATYKPKKKRRKRRKPRKRSGSHR